MEKCVFRKSLVIGLIILFVGAGVVSGINIQINNSEQNRRGDTLYVGGSGGDNYSKIQDAIDNASNGDTVFVYDDSAPYYENVIIDKSIDFIGENRDTTVIDGNNLGDVVYVGADWVSITGFTIKNGYFGIYLTSSSSNTITGNTIDNNDFGIRLEYSSDNNMITGNTIDNNNFGIRLEYSSDNTITGNTITDNTNDGIRLEYSSDNTITGNTITDNTNDGIRLEYSSDNTITGNTIDNNNFGIRLAYSSDNTIKDNVFQSNGILIYGYLLEHWTSHTIENNIANGRPIRYYKNTENVNVSGNTAQVILANCSNFMIQNLNLSNIDSGIQLGFSSDNTITGNTITDNTNDGIRLRDSSDNTITGNTITDNTNTNGGIWLRYSSDNTITGNTIDNHWGGIRLDYSSDRNTITGNTITDNNNFGILLRFSSDNNMITGNTIRDNNDDGIRLDYSSNSNNIYHNNLLNNGQNAYDECNNQWDNNYPSGGNYWDDYTGIDSDGDGIGDTPYPVSGGDNEDRYPLMGPWGNQPPNAPTITGETNGNAGTEYEYTFNAVDSDGDNVKYHIDWDDGDSDTTAFSSSGTDVKVKHTWTNQDTYIIRVTAEDTNGLVGPEGTLSVSMPRNRAIQTPFLQFLEQYPILYQLLQRFLQL